MPLRKTARNSPAGSVFDRASPCGSQKTTRTRSISSSIASTCSAAAACRSSQRPNSAIKAGLPTLLSRLQEDHGRENMIITLSSLGRAPTAGDQDPPRRVWRIIARDRDERPDLGVDLANGG